MNNQINPQRAADIDLKEVIWKLLSQWKAVILVSVAMAVLICGAKYVLDSKSYSKAEEAMKNAESQADLSVDEKIEKQLEQLPSEERDALRVIIQQKKLLAREQEYLDNSILMNLDPTNRRSVTIKYYVKGSDGVDMQVLTDSFNTYISKKSFISKVGNVISPGTKQEYIYELISGWAGTLADSNVRSTLYSIRFILPEDVDADELIEIADEEIKKISKDLNKKIGSHTIEKINTEETHTLAYDTVDRSITMNYAINNLNSSILNASSLLSEDQNLVLDAVFAVMNNADAAAEDTESSDSAEKPSNAPAWNLKYAALGFVFGAMMYACIYFALLILKGGIGSASSLKNYTRKKLFGEVYYDSESDGIKRIMHSKAVDKRHYRGKDDMAVQISKISGSIDAVCKHLGSEELTLIDMTGSDSEREKEIIDTVINEINGKELDIDLVRNGEDLDENQLLDIKNAVLAVSSETKAKTIGAAITQLNDYDINTLGSMYIAEK